MHALVEVVASWVKNGGYLWNGPMFNIYHVSPGVTQNPEEWVTEACFPVKKRTRNNRQGHRALDLQNHEEPRDCLAATWGSSRTVLEKIPFSGSIPRRIP